jgi:uncharacterized protein
MDGYKHIERCIGGYIAGRYYRAVEVGIGRNTEAAEILANAGILIRSTDIKDLKVPEKLTLTADDVFSPDLSLYHGADVIYSIRPAVEMIPPLISLAQRVDADLLVYHLGFESYGNGGEKIDCGVTLHRYVRGQKPSNRVA